MTGMGFNYVEQFGTMKYRNQEIPICFDWLNNEINNDFLPNKF